MAPYRGRDPQHRCHVLQIGGYPPPYGGVTVHIQRLVALLQPELEVRVVDTVADLPVGWDPEAPFVYRLGAVNERPTRALRIPAVLSRIDCHVAHVHAGSFERFALMAHPLLSALPRHAARVLTIHSGSFPLNVAKAGAPRRALLRSVLSRFHHVVCVSTQIQEAVAGLGVPVDRTTVVPAYLPPVPAADPQLDAIVERLQGGARKLLLVAGFARDYYGFHVLLDALERDPELRAAYGVVFAFYTQYDEAYHQGLLDRLDRDGWNAATVDNLTPEHFAYLLSRMHLFVRPTDRDGDSVAVREARGLGLQVLASDCVARPDGCALFRTMDAEDLSRVLGEALRDDALGTGEESAGGSWAALRDVYARLDALEDW